MADNLDPVIKTIIAEALGEGQTGMQMVGETILNRAQQRGLTPEGVVTQPSQYTGYWSPGSAAQKAFNDPNVVTAAQAAWQMAQGADDPTGGANHYFNPNLAQPSWARNMTPTTTYGGHAFYTDRPVTQQVAQSGKAPSPQTQSNSIQRQRDLIPSIGSGASPALQQAMAMLASSGSNPYPQTQSDDLGQMRDPNMSLTARYSQVTPSGNVPFPRPRPNGTNLVGDSMSAIQQKQRQMRAADLGLITINGVTPRLTDDGSNIYSYHIPDMTPTAVVGGLGSLTPGVKRNLLPPIGPTGSGPGAVKYSASGLNSIPMAGSVKKQANADAARLAALKLSQSYAGQEGYGQAGSSSKKLTTQQLAALYSGGGPTRPNANQLTQLPQGVGLTPRPGANLMSNAPINVVGNYAANGLASMSNLPRNMPRGNSGPGAPATGVVAPLPLMASAALQARRGNAPLMAAAGVPSPSPLKVVVNGAGSYTAQPQQQVAQPMNTGLTPVQTLQQQGLSNAQAYNLLNSLNSGSLGVGERITGAGTQASSGSSANSIYG